MNLRCFLSIGTVCLLSAVSHSENRTVNLSSRGIKPDKKTNYTAAINKLIEKETAKMGESDTLTLIFTSGKYNLYPDKSMARTLYISNHDQDNPKLIGLLLDGKHNIVIDGNGADLICHGRMLPIAAINCRNLTVKNISIDFEQPHIAQVRVVENDTTSGTITYKPEPWVDYNVVGGKFVHIGEGWEHTPTAGIAFEPDSRHIVYNTSDIWVGVNNVTDMGNGLIKAPWNNKALKPGTVIAMRTYGRPAPAIFVDECRNTTLENTKIHYAEGMGLLAQNSIDLTLKGFSVCLRGDNDPRYFTTQADATHFSGCSGHINSTGGLYEGMMDDAINVHGTYLKVIKRIDDQTLVGEYMHNQSYGFRWANVGDSVNIIKSRTMDLSLSGLTVAEISPVDCPTVSGAKKFMIRFNQNIPAEINPEGSMYGLENISATPSVRFADNIVRNNRARGALFSTPRTVVCENNTFDHTSGCAVLLCGDCNGWFETGSCRDVTIRGNNFINALTNLFQFTNAVISIYPEIPDLKNQTGYFHSNITITDNRFETFDIPLLYAKSVDGLIFRNNSLIKNTDFAPFHWNKSQIWLERVNNARIQAIED